MPISPRRVPGSGPKHADIVFAGEGPGRDEDKSGRAFTGPSGRLLWAMAKDYAGIDRSDVYVTNLSKYRLTDDHGKDRAPTEEEAAEWAPELQAEVANIAPSLVITLGRWSTWALTGKSRPMSVMNGMLYPAGISSTLIPCVHPAAGLHQPQLLSATSEGLKAVGRWLSGDVVAAPSDEYPSPSYAVWPKTKLKIRLGKEVAIDTEGPTSAPWSLQFCDRPGIARLIRADDVDHLAEFRQALERNRPTIILHHALHDLAALKSMGVDLLAMGLEIRDTMIELFLLQTEPQGLKESALRLCGMEMREYEDVVGPVAERFATEYLSTAISEPLGEWGIGDGRKHSIVRRIEGLIRPRPTKGDARTIRQKWDDEKAFGPVRTEVERIVGPMPKPTMDDIPPEDFIPYACRDADATCRQSLLLPARIDRDNLRRVHKVDHDALPLIARMQEVGMLVDTVALDELRGYVRDELRTIVYIIRALVEDDGFNPASGDQVADYCVRQKLPLDRRTKGGKRIQVDDNQLTLVRFDDPAIEPILRFRELDKLRSTYIDPMPKFLVGEGRYRRIHPSFRTTATITGRLAIGGDSSVPLLGMPTRSEDGRKTRGVFVAAEGNVLASCDLSQIELRCGAGLSQDPEMMESYAAGADLHARTASKLFGKPEAAIDPMTERYPCKTANFAIFYGAREYRLNAEFLKAGIPGFDLPRCAEFVKEWFELYAGVARWIDETYRFGAENGFVQTEAGRRRYVPGLRFTSDEYPFGKCREEAQRQASNFPIQGTAQEIIKRAMPKVNDILVDLRTVAYVEPLLQVHDELLFEVDEEIAEEVGAMVVEAMTSESPFYGVPLMASWRTAGSWDLLK
jgi:uracil-DNA glycosylase family 4